MEIIKSELIQQGIETCSALIHALEAFTEQQFNRVPPTGGWTAGQVAEHLLLSAGVVDAIAGNTATAKRAPNSKVDALAAIFLDFSIKLQSPDLIIPAAQEYDQQEMIARLKAVWTKIKEAVCILDLSVVCLDFEFPGLGHLTRLEWINFYIFHTQRHLRQLDRLLTPAPNHRRLPLPGR